MDLNNNKALNLKKSSDTSNMDIENCIAQCSDYTFAGLQNGFVINTF